jgi:hypothetical protein
MLVLKCHGDWAPGQRFEVRSVYQNEALGTGLSWTPMGIEVSSSNSGLSRGQRPTALLCTLHSLAYPRTTQHSVPAAGTFCRVGLLPGLVPQRSFRFLLEASPPSRLYLTHISQIGRLPNAGKRKTKKGGVTSACFSPKREEEPSLQPCRVYSFIALADRQPSGRKSLT